MWEEMDRPYLFERMTEFSIPRDDRLLIASTEGLQYVRLSPEIAIDRVDASVEYLGDYDPVWDGVRFEMLGNWHCDPIIVHPDGGEVLDLDLEAQTLLVLGTGGDVRQEIRFDDMSGDWGVATFSADGKYLVIGVPYDIYIYRRTTGPPEDPGRAAPGGEGLSPPEDREA
ncbi:MAG: hypothetical protein ACAI43_01330 [Phycisphaerae bacterium]|nr:hypothetical protein [Tepidisphaeraceae bacterium]